MTRKKNLLGEILLASRIIKTTRNIAQKEFVQNFQIAYAVSSSDRRRQFEVSTFDRSIMPLATFSTSLSSTPTAN